ncbi:Hsp33 family molecular chaperone HslO [Leptospira idonii]|uniref:Hsp33 family molecular chaperone HslO n=1 Tax=Leptospira idonii TaxID=1193500 RepID=A0A4R9M2K1_9LEPT|nr:Hsp33 family molecular chaperone HslO [Leptospira idonii]TGN20342.1 Hsp33 family molecular chaperone HslO [Leptospira idonii]
MTDTVILGILPEYHFRFSIVDLTETAKEVALLHELNSDMSVFLSKTMMGALFLAEMTKNQQRVSIQWKDETNKSALAYSDRYGKMKAVGYGAELEKGDIRNEFILGQGIMKVIRWEVESDFYQSYTNLVEDTFEFNFLKYLTESEQVRAIVGMDVNPLFQTDSEFKAKAIMFQALPEAAESDYKYLSEKINPVIAKESFWDLSIEEMKSELTIAIASELVVLSTEEPEFLCDCSRFKVSEIILSLGRIEADSIVDEVGQVEITCEFCKKAYQFNKEEVEHLFNQ